MAHEGERAAARLAAFTLVEAVQVRDVGDELVAAQANSLERGWPEVTRVLLYAELVRRSLSSDPGVGDVISALYDQAERAGDYAMLSVALASRAEHRLTSDDPLVRQGFDNDLARAVALIQVSTDGALERATAYVACAIAYSLRDMWELEEELYAEAAPVLAECELPLLDAAVLINRADASVRLLCGLREVEATDDLGRLEQGAADVIDAAMNGGIPLSWLVEVAVFRHLLSAIVHGRTPGPSSLLDQQITDTHGPDTAAARGLLRLSDALCAANDGDWPLVADQAEQALELLSERFVSSARALTLRLAAQAEAELGTVGALHTLRYADYSSRRHWESRTQMVGAARASTHTEQLRIERDRHARDALADELTGLANRRGYSRHLEALRGRTGRLPLAVLVVDVDDFKSINDNHGHAIGDEVLARVAATLAMATRPHDLVARMGGDEFVALLDDLDETAACRRAADLLKRLAAVPWASLSPGLDLRVSVGVAAGSPGDDPEELVLRADFALYAAKARGGDNAQVAEEHNDRWQQHRSSRVRRPDAARS